MAQIDKLLKALKECSGPFPYADVVKILRHIGYDVKNGSGSSRKFYNRTTGAIIALHEPHPGKEILPYAVRAIREHLSERGYL